MTLQTLGKDYNESIYIPLREEADYQHSQEAEFDRWASPKEAPSPMPKDDSPKLLKAFTGAADNVVHGITLPFQMLSNAALAPIAAGSETVLDAFSEAGRAAYNTATGGPGGAEWQAQKVIERYFPDMQGGKKLAASIALDVLADPTTAMGFGVAGKLGKAVGLPSRAETKTAAKMLDTPDVDPIVDLMQRADAGDMKARIELLNSAKHPEKFESMKATLLENYNQDTSRLTRYKSFPVSADSVGHETLIKSARAEGAPKLLISELSGEFAKTPYRFRQRYLDINSPEDITAYLVKRGQETTAYVLESLKKATPKEAEEIKVLLAGQRDILSHNISDKVVRDIDNVQAFAINGLFEDIAQSMQKMMAKTEYMFESGVDRVRFFKLLGLREQIRAELTLSTKPASKLLSSLNTRAIDGSQAIRNLMFNRAERAVPSIDPKAERAIAPTPSSPMQMSGDDFKKLRTFLRKTDSPAQLNTFLNNFMDETYGDKLHRGWLHSLLSGTGTHLRNITTNAVFAAERPFFDVAASVVNPSNAPEHLTTGLKRVVGMAEASWDSLQAISLLGRETKVPMNKEQWKGLHELSARIPQLSKSAIAELGRNRGLEWVSHHLPMHLLAGEDTWFKAVNARGQLRASAWSRAWKLTDDPVGRRAIYQKLVDDPTEAMKIEALETAEIGTFQQDLGKLSAQWTKTIARTPGLRWITPFLKTPSNILFEGGRHVPVLNFLSRKLRADMAAGGARRDAAIGQLAFTNSTFLAFMLAPTDGRITGRGTATHSQDRSGLPQYSIKVGDEWYSYQANEILRWVIGIPVSLKETFQQVDWQAEDKADEAWRTTGLITSAFAGTLSESFWMYNLGNAVHAVESAFSKQSLAPMLRLGERLAGSTVPGIVRQMAKTIDPAIRHTEDLLDRMNNAFLVGRGSLPIDVDLLGNKRKHNLSSVWSGINITDPTDDELVLRLRKLNPRLPDVSKVYMGQELTGRERMLMRSWTAQGPAGLPPLRDGLLSVMNDQEFGELSLADKRLRVESLIQEYNKRSLDMLIQGR